MSRWQLPERWLLCPRFGAQVTDDAKFVPMKTMLDARYDDKIPEEHRWTPEMLVARHPNVGMVIDLTKSSRYYDPRFLPKHIFHQKIQCAGRGSTPTPEQVTTFIGVCNMFWSKYPDKQIAVHCTHGFNRTGFMIIAYMCHHLEYQTEAALHLFKRARPPGMYKEHYIRDACERFEGDPSEFLPVVLPDWCLPNAELFMYVNTAVEILKASEGAPIKGQKLTELCEVVNNALSAAEDDTMFLIFKAHGWTGLTFANEQVASPTKLGEELEAALEDMRKEAEQVEDEVDDGNPAATDGASAANPPTAAATDGTAAEAQPAKKKKIRPDDPRCETEEAVPTGLRFSLDNRPSVGPPHLGPLRKKCRELVGASQGISFPGSQPVSLLKHHLESIRTSRHLVSHKADGTRYLMMILGPDRVYMVGRDNSIFHVPGLTFPTSGRPDQQWQNTVLDGELVTDVWDDGKSRRFRFFIFDMMCCGGKSFTKYAYHQRLEAISREIMKPRERLKVKGRLDTSKEPFGIRLKEFFPFHEYGTEKWHRYIKRGVRHKIDGLLIVADNHEYKPGTCEALLKWKPPELNSIDFLVKTTECEGYTEAQLLVSGNGGAMVPFTDAGVSTLCARSDEKRRVLRSINGKIAECSWVPETKRWKVVLIRRDKDHPNAYRTAKNVWRSIYDGITQHRMEELARQLRDSRASRARAGVNPVDQAINTAVAAAREHAAALEQADQPSAKRAKSDDDKGGSQARTTPLSLIRALASVAKIHDSFKEVLLQYGWKSDNSGFDAPVSADVLRRVADQLARMRR